MTCTIKPSDIYVGYNKDIISNWLNNKSLRVKRFGIVEPGDQVLDVSTGYLRLVRATKPLTGYVRLILEEVNQSGLDTIWE